jgi:hypothetical protein
MPGARDHPHRAEHRQRRDEGWRRRRQERGHHADARDDGGRQNRRRPQLLEPSYPRHQNARHRQQASRQRSGHEAYPVDACRRERQIDDRRQAIDEPGRGIGEGFRIVGEHKEPEDDAEAEANPGEAQEAHQHLLPSAADSYQDRQRERPQHQQPQGGGPGQRRSLEAGALEDHCAATSE